MRGIFQSTHPSWGATNARSDCGEVSNNFNPRTHRGVRLLKIASAIESAINFNPRTHRGVRPSTTLSGSFNMIFQSTHPSWGATFMKGALHVDNLISIHAPIVGCDPIGKPFILCLQKFQSTHPSWGATAKIAKFLLEFHYF